MQWLDELLRNLEIVAKFVWLTNLKTLIGVSGILVGLWLFKVLYLDDIRDAKAQGTALPIGTWAGIIAVGIIVLVSGIIVAIGVAEQYPQH